MLARHPIRPVCVVLVPPGVRRLLIVISFVFSAAGWRGSMIAIWQKLIELDRDLVNVACKIILEFGSVVDFYVGDKTLLRVSCLLEASPGRSPWLALKPGSHGRVWEKPKGQASVLIDITCHLKS